MAFLALQDKLGRKLPLVKSKGNESFFWQQQAGLRAAGRNRCWVPVSSSSLGEVPILILPSANEHMFPLKCLMLNWNLRPREAQLTILFWPYFSLSLILEKDPLISPLYLTRKKLVLWKCRIWEWQTCTALNTVDFCFKVLKRIKFMESFEGYFPLN